MSARCHGLCDRVSFRGFLRNYENNTYCSVCAKWINKIHLKAGKDGMANFCPCCGGRARRRARFNHANRKANRIKAHENIPKNKPICKIVFGGERNNV